METRTARPAAPRRPDVAAMRRQHQQAMQTAPGWHVGEVLVLHLLAHAEVTRGDEALVALAALLASRSPSTAAALGQDPT